MRTWAAVVGTRDEASPKTPNPSLETSPKESKSNSTTNRDIKKDGADKTAAKRKLLEEALKSRANVATGERRCLGCGVAFRDVVRLAQHLADKHGGVNAVETSDHHSGALVLDQLTIRYVGKGMSPKVTTKNTKYNTGFRDIKKKKQQTLTTPSTSAPLQAPEGTRVPRRRRPSRLKKGFRLAKAQEAVAHWLAVLESIEEAVQSANEHRDALANEAAAAVAVQGHSSNLSVQGQLLNEQARLVSERIEQLLGVHEAARTHLSNAQAALQEALPKQTDQGASNQQSEKPKKQDTAASTQQHKEEGSRAIGELHHESEQPPQIQMQKCILEEEECSFDVDEQDIASTSTSTSTSGTSSSSGGSFALQWGDALRAWAQTALPLDGHKQKASTSVRTFTPRPPTETHKQPTSKEETTQGACRGPPTTQQPLQPLPSSQNQHRAQQAEQAAVTVNETEAEAEYVEEWLKGAEFQDPPPSVLSIDDPPERAPETASILIGTTVPLQRQDSGNILCCTVCNIFTFSSHAELEQHIRSNRHQRKLQALARLKDKEVSEVLQHRPPQRRYVGENADVEDYVDHVITPELNTAVEALLTKLLEWQNRTRALDPMNAKRKRRVVSGFREVEKFAKNGKAKLIVIAPNVGRLAAVPAVSVDKEVVETCSKEKRASSLDPVNQLLDVSQQHSIPIVFALSRQRLGRLLGARRTASAFAVLDVSGGEALLAQVIRIHSLVPLVK